MTEDKLKVASLFCGCGGLDLGMLGGFDYLGKNYGKLGYDIVYAADFDKWAVETYNQNFENKAVCADVTQVDFEKLPDVDVLTGGFPCQSFSSVNLSGKTTDDRSQLYKQVVRFLHVKHPKYFICENVKGLITKWKGEFLQQILEEFRTEGYTVKVKLMKAVEFGIPQKRERIFIVGVRNDIDCYFEYPSPVITDSKDYVPLKKALENESLVPQDTKYYFSQKAVIGVKTAVQNWKRGIWQDISKPCVTITAHLAKLTMHSSDPILLVDPSKELYRRFTPREAARIQSFPETFKIHPAELKAYRQVGNAVPPVLGWYMANALLDSIRTTKWKREKGYILF